MVGCFVCGGGGIGFDVRGMKGLMLGMVDVVCGGGEDIFMGFVEV